MEICNKIICGDNTEILKTIPYNYIDLVVTSPPYQNLRTYNGYSFDFENTAKELYRTLKIGGVICWIVGDSVVDGSETLDPLRQALYFKEICGFRVLDTMIYQKNGQALPDKTRYGQCWEYMFILSKGKPKTINLLRDKKNRWAGVSNFGANTIRQKDGTLTEIKKCCPPEFGIRYNIWKYATGFGYTTKDKIAFEHPAIFPESLAGDAILSWSNPGDLVLDPFNGSGTTCLMAKKLRRNYIGIDISEQYCTLARTRLKNSDNREDFIKENSKEKMKKFL